MASGDGGRSRRETMASVAAKYYAPHTQNLSTTHHHRNFARLSKVNGTNATRLNIDHDELRRFSLVQVKINLQFFFFIILSFCL
jgi:hypothetical protein